MELAILTALEEMHPMLLRRTVLQGDMSRMVDGFTKTAFDRALVVLENKGQIRIHAGEDVTRIAITDTGLERLAATR